MDSLIHKINLDCLRKDSQAIVNAKIGEASGRKIVFTLYEGRAPFFVPSGTTVVFRAKKPSGAVLYNNCVVDDGKIEYTITSQTVAEKGVFPCEIQIIGADNKVIYTPCITLNVTENLYSDTEVESSNEFTELENALNKIPSLEVIYSKYTKPDGGIPKSDLAQDVQNSLNKADTALQEHQSLAAYRTAEAQDLIDNAKQDKLVEGENITIAEDGKTISAKGVGVLEVTLTTQNDVSTADKTFEQVKAAVDSGIPVLKVHSDGAILWFFLLDKSPTEIDFVGLVDEQIIAYLTAKQDGTWETTVAARVTEEMLSSLNDKLGNLNDLDTEAKNNLVAAINEAAQSGGGGASIELDTTLTQSGKAADAKATGDALAGKQDKLIAGDNITIAADGKTISATGGGGISTTAKNLLITILRNAVYSTDQSNNITALDTALGGGTTEPEEPDVPVETTYAISNELTNCTTSNSATSAKENAAYSTTLTANDGYTLTGGTVTVTMGGVDITATAYADGVITIAAVTGDVEIFASAVVVQAEAALPEDGLIGYFDFRTTTYDNAASGGKTTIAPTKGSGQLFTWAINSISAQNGYGLKPANTRKLEYDQNGGTNATALGDAFTVIQLTYGEAPSFGFRNSNMPPAWMFGPKYINTSGSTVEAEKIIGSNFNSDSKDDYNFTVFRADGATLTEIFDTSRTTYNGGDIGGFSRWLDTPYGNIADIGDTKYCTAMAIYNRALTDSEIEAAREFMKTLEVTA